MASSPEVIEDLDSDSSVVFLNSIDPYYFYEVKGPNNYVEIMTNIPYRYTPEENWIVEMRDWYLNTENLDNPVIYDDGSKEISGLCIIDKDSLDSVPDNPVNTGGTAAGEVIYEKVEREKITFETTAVGVPHLIKMSYFPNWQVTGAEGPYLVSPSLMMVIPTRTEVTLYYGMSYANKIGVTLTWGGWAIIIIALIMNIVFVFKKRKSATGKAVETLL